MADPPKVDPVRDSYYAPLEGAERWENWIFLAAAALSFAVLLVDNTKDADLYNAVHVAFVILVIAVFAMGLLIRLYLSPRAEGSRRDDLLANAFLAVTAQPQTIGYYNNNQRLPFPRLGANLLESSFFSKAIALEMARGQRWRIALYLVAWLTTATYLRWDLAWSAAIAQAVFSEQVFSRYLRLEWLRSRYETSYRQLSQLFEAVPSNAELMQRRVLQELCFYEASKSNAGVLLSSRIFKKKNARLNEQWEAIRANLKL